MSLDAERSENMGRPKGSASIYDEGPRSARCETCGFCAVSEAVMTASGEGRKRYTCMRCPDFVHATQGLARCNYWEALHEGLVMGRARGLRARVRSVRQAVPHGVQEPEVLLRMVRERGAKGREQAARGRVPRNEE